jgi:hypothetical protein
MRRFAATAGLAALVVLGSCAQTGRSPAAIEGSSQTLVVRGQYAPLAIERVDRLAVENGKVVARGGAESAPVPVPATADTARPNRRWALITEGLADDKRRLTFTHEESLDDFTIELPPSDAAIHYGVFSGSAGDDVMVLAWGEGSRSYSAYVTIVKAAAGR